MNLQNGLRRRTRGTMRNSWQTYLNTPKETRRGDGFHGGPNFVVYWPSRNWKVNHFCVSVRAFGLAVSRRHHTELLLQAGHARADYSASSRPHSVLPDDHERIILPEVLAGEARATYES